MSSPRVTTIADYIDAAPPAGQPHLKRMHALLRTVAPHAAEAIKWGTPFFVEPRFLFAFSAHKAHLSFAPTPASLLAHRDELADHKTTKGTLKIPYEGPFPEALVRRIAESCVKELKARKDEGFW